MEISGFYIGSRPRLNATAFGDERLVPRTGRMGRPGNTEKPSSTVSEPRAVLLVHWLPRGSWDDDADELLDGVASKLASMSGLGVLAPRLRGIGASEGDFSVSGWCRDIAATIDYLASSLSAGDKQPEIFGVGFGVGGSCLLSVAAGDTRIRGVAAAGAPAEFANSSLSHDGYIKKARSAGLIRSESFPPDPYSWRRELIAYAPLHHARRLANRPVLLIYRENDKIVSSVDTERLAEAIGDSCVTQSMPRSAPAALVKFERVIESIGTWLRKQLDQVENANEAI
jgi:pimeloyl-ACP methyl ester carboxylesterase